MRVGEREDGRPVILCDACNRDTRLGVADPEDATPRPDDNSLEGHLELHGSYGSTIYDLTIVKAELCERCVQKVVKWINEQAAKSGARGVQEIDSLEADERYWTEEVGADRSELVRSAELMKKHREPSRKFIERSYDVVLRG